MGVLALSLALLSTGVAADDAGISVALAPGAGHLSSVFSHLQTRREGVLASGLKELDQAMALQLAEARNAISAVVGKDSFLTVPEVLIKVASSPTTGSAAVFSQFAQMADKSEVKLVSQAKSEFKAISNAVVAELARALGKSSFLTENPLNLKVGASHVPFTSGYGMMMLSAKKGAEADAAFTRAVMAKEHKFVQSLHELIASALK